jgi:hypothetical protein
MSIDLGVRQGVLVLADISGYTEFSRLHFTSLLHAEEIITELLESVLDSAEFPLQIGRLEGDAVLLYAEAPAEQAAAAARDAAAQAQKFIVSFNQRERSLIACDAGCVCQACQQIGDLKLKAVLHYGRFTLRDIGGVVDLIGDDILLMHKLIKAPIRQREHILLTPGFYQLSGKLNGDAIEESHTISIDDSVVDVHVYFPKLDLNAIPDLPGSGPAFSARLNKHSFARMFGLRSGRSYSNLPRGKMNLVLYLLEGLGSGVNVLKKQFRRMRSRGSIVKPAMLMLVDAGSPEQLPHILDTIRPPLVLNKLEGSVAMLFAPAEDDASLLALGLFQQSRSMISAIHSVPRVRVLLHYGDVAFKKIRQFDELAGTDVILVHRLLKHLEGQTSSVWFTDAYYQILKTLHDPEFTTQTIDTDIQEMVILHTLSAAK